MTDPNCGIEDLIAIGKRIGMDSAGEAVLSGVSIEDVSA